MKRIDAYLFFENECREAMTFYQQCLGGDLSLMPMGESAVADQMPADKKDLIMHSSLINGGVILHGADNCMGNTLVKGKTMALSLNCSSDEELHDIYNKLSAGGTATHTPRVEFWGDTFGMLTDKFGVDWMLSYRPQE
ncbi:VOC family protein [Sediminibacterium ginsengisoli]|uniref:PhnB protein n=1 Tax=Sediminibacterium ginsengisoli TaxID=413434 RepID=A0A1T4RRR9_9BACT|nr:VOC family protein [Sediminibacterium ginsengisoli]SKA18680.1 PhnB protein [Sediminibacterium ginsengisoli]